jgi:hypothetical protein
MRPRRVWRRAQDDLSKSAGITVQSGYFGIYGPVHAPGSRGAETSRRREFGRGARLKSGRMRQARSQRADRYARRVTVVRMRGLAT